MEFVATSSSSWSASRPIFQVVSDKDSDAQTIQDDAITASLVEVWTGRVGSVRYTSESHVHEAKFAPDQTVIHQKNTETGHVLTVYPAVAMRPGFEFCDSAGVWQPIESSFILEGLADVYTEHKASFDYQVGANSYEATLAVPPCFLAQRNVQTNSIRAVRASPFLPVFEVQDDHGQWMPIESNSINKQIAAVMAGNGPRQCEFRVPGASAYRMEYRDGTSEGSVVQKNVDTGHERLVRRSLQARPCFEFLLDPNASIRWAGIVDQDAAAALLSAYHGAGGSAVQYTTKNHLGAALTYSAHRHPTSAYLMQKNAQSGVEHDVRPMGWTLSDEVAQSVHPPRLSLMHKQPSSVSWLQLIGEAVRASIEPEEVPAVPQGGLVEGKAMDPYEVVPMGVKVQ